MDVDFETEEVVRGRTATRTTYTTTMTEETSVVHHVPVTSYHEEEIIHTERDFSDNSVYLTSTPNVGRSEPERYSATANDSAECTFISSKLDSTPNYGERPAKKCVTLLQSFSMENDGAADEFEVDTLENHLFPDMSYTESGVVYDDAQFKPLSPSRQSKWSKLYGITYLSANSTLLTSDEDDDGQKINTVDDVLSSSINHPNRSHFRQRRREWYLNRRNASNSMLKSKVKKTKSRRQTYGVLSIFTKLYYFLSMIITKSYLFLFNLSSKTARFTTATVTGVTQGTLRIITSTVVWIISLIKGTYCFIYSRVGSFLHQLFSLTKRSASSADVETKKLKSSAECSCLGIFCWLLIIVIALGLFGMTYDSESSPKLVPNPHTNGIYNAHTFYVDTNKKIPAWHIFPKQAKLSSLHAEKILLKSTSPVIMFLRNAGEVNDHRLKNIYDTMFSLGYHVIVPTDVLPQSAVIQTWKWIKDQTNATAYLWGFGIDPTILTETAKVLCKHLFPPNGVIIAKEVKSENLPQSMEIWSCNCALTQSVNNTSATDFKYNHIKCPIAFDGASSDVYSQVVHCIETVNKNMDS